MSQLSDSIENYCNMSSSGALMVSGDWGTGKTYHIEHEVFEQLRKRDLIPLRVSLFGVTDTKDIQSKMIAAYLSKIGNKDDTKGDKMKNIALKGVQTLITIAEYIPNDKVDISKIISNNIDIVSQIIPSDKTILFFDDLERVDVELFNSFLGFFNDLIEQRKFKIIIIANNSYLDNNGIALKFKEKVIEKTVQYVPDIRTIYDELLSELTQKQPFRDLMKQDDMVKFIDPLNPLYSSNKELQSELYNIRTIKFALSHFLKIFQSVSGFQPKKDEEKNNLFTIFLKSLWATTVGLSIAHKNNRIVYSDRDIYKNYSNGIYTSINPILQLIEIDEPQTEGQGTESDEKNKKEESIREQVMKMNEIFIQQNSLPHVETLPLFDFIIAGAPIDEESLNSSWNNYQQEIEQQKTDQGYALLNRFTNDIDSFSDEEMPKKLIELAGYVEEGHFSDSIHYVNAYNSLHPYWELTTFSEDDLQQKVKTGIDTLYGQKDINQMRRFMIELAYKNTPQTRHWVLDYITEKDKALDNKKMKDDIDEVIRLFSEDMDGLKKILIPQFGDCIVPRLYRRSVLHNIPKNEVIKKMGNIKPAEMSILNQILLDRFSGENPHLDPLEELPFVKSLSEGISQRPTDKRTFSDIWIETTLKKTIEKILSNKK